MRVFAMPPFLIAHFFSDPHLCEAAFWELSQMFVPSKLNH
jgi:hypothetical protein